MTRIFDHRFPVTVFAGCALALFAAACASAPDSDSPDGMVYEDTDSDAAGTGPQGAAPAEPGANASLPKSLQAYDANHDGSLTRAELEAGLQGDFAAADLNHDGKLELEEMRAVNDKRWHEDGAAVTPLADWNGDGVVDFNEFATGPRSLFDQIDKNQDGVLSPREINPRALKHEKSEASRDAPPHDGGKPK